MELKIFLDILKRHALIIIIVIAMALMVMIVIGLVRTPVYKAEAKMRVLLDPGLPDYLRRQDFNDRLIATYQQILLSTPILKTVLTNLEPRTSTMSTSDLRPQIIVENIPNTELLRITIQNEDPVLARDLANMFGTALIDYAKNFYEGGQENVTPLLEKKLVEIDDELNQDRTKLDELLRKDTPTTEIEILKTRIKNLETSQDLYWKQYETAQLSQDLQANSITFVQPASIPGEPANALNLMDMVLTVALGLAGGIGLVLILENLDTRIRSPQQLERLTRLPILGIVPHGILSLNGSGQIDETTSQSVLAEAYRLASLNLQRLTQSCSAKTILITSAGPHEGKTTIATNLARVLAEWGKTVFLVEADMRRPSLDKKFGMNNGYVGLSSLLVELSSLDQVIHMTEQSTLFVIGGGPVPHNPIALLGSPPMDRLLTYLGDQAQMTLIDAPPVLGIADVSILAPKVDGVILVAHQDLTSQEQINQAIKQLEAVQANILCSIFIQRQKKNQKYAY